MKAALLGLLNTMEPRVANEGGVEVLGVPLDVASPWKRVAGRIPSTRSMRAVQPSSGGTLADPRSASSVSSVSDATMPRATPRSSPEASSMAPRRFSAEMRAVASPPPAGGRPLIDGGAGIEPTLVSAAPPVRAPGAPGAPYADDTVQMASAPVHAASLAAPSATPTSSMRSSMPSIPIEVEVVLSPSPSPPPANARAGVGRGPSMVDDDEVDPEALALRLAVLTKEALIAGDAQSLERWADGLKATGEKDGFAERMRAMARLSKGRVGDALSRLQRARREADAANAPLAQRCQAALALAVGLAFAGRSDEALLEALDAIARAREANDVAAARACMALMAKLYARTGRTMEAATLIDAAR